MQAATFLVEANIVRGNTLSGYLVDEDGSEASQELITFSWWHRVDGKPGVVQRETFTLESLRKPAQDQGDLFDLFDLDMRPATCRARSTRCTRRPPLMASPNIETFREVVPYIYSWKTPDIPKYDGWEKIGYTEQDSADTRIASRRASSTSRRSRSGRIGRRS